MHPRAALLPLALLCIGLAGASCGLLNAVTEAPAKLASSITPAKPKPKLAPDQLEQRLMRFGDVVALELQKSTDEFARTLGTPEARIQALEWRIEYLSAVWNGVTVTQPYAGLFDTILLVTALRLAHEERWSAQWGDADGIVIASLRGLEESAWKLAEEGMTPAQVEASHAVIDKWAASDPAERLADVSALPGLEQLAQSNIAADLIGGLTDLVRLDPLGEGLDPLARALQQSSALAERALYTLQRMPELLEARVELLSLRTTSSDEAHTALTSWERASRSAESLAATAESLPAQLSTERSAAVTQLSSELERQRSGLLEDLEGARAPLGEILGETRTTAEATRALSESLAVTIASLGTFLDRFEDDPNAPPEPPSDARPFDVTEYGTAAERIGTAARELNEAITTLDRNLPALQRALDESAARGERTIDHAYRRALELLGLTLAGAVVAVLLVRRLSGRRSVAGPQA